MTHRYTVSLLTVLATSLIIASCRREEKKDEAPEPSFAINNPAEVPPVPIVRLDTGIAGFPELDKESRNKFIEDNRQILWGYEEIVDGGELPVDNITVLGWATSDVTQLAAPEVARVYPNLNDLSKKLGVILKTAEYNHLDLPSRRYVAVTWAGPKSIVKFDSISTTYIALNHYLGRNHPYYADFSDNTRALKEPRMLPVDLAEAITAINYPYSPAIDNVLSRMLYDGVMAVVKESMVPDATRAEVLGFIPEEMAAIEEREGSTWSRLVADNKLYSTDAAVLSNLFELRPTSTLIGADAPGRVVRYNGYRIVKDYIREHPDVTLKELLSPDFYGDGAKVLRDSKYAPSDTRR